MDKFIVDSYSIQGLKDLPILKYLKRAQFTLNGRVSLSKRKTVDAITHLSSKTDLYIHQDYYHSAYRYLLFTEQRKKDFITELADLFELSLVDHRLKGYILHTDNPFNKAMWSALESLNGDFSEHNLLNAWTSTSCSTMYKSSDECAKVLKSVADLNAPNHSDFPPHVFLLHKYCYTCISTILSDFTTELLRRGYKHSSLNLIVSKPHMTIYLENMAQSHPYLVNSPVYLADLAKHTSPLLGICFDTLHEFASGGIAANSTSIEFLCSHNHNVLVHLNAIEKGVAYGNFKDRHSNTTLSECTHYDLEYYREFISYLNKQGIPYIREVSTDTRNREQAQLTETNKQSTETNNQSTES